MKSFDKIQIKTGLKDFNAFNLSCTHKTTMDFMLLQPVYYRHLVPNQSIKVDVRSFVRMAAMPVPTFGDASLHLSAYFVPYRQICPYFDALMTDSVYTPHNQSLSFIPQRVPIFRNTTIVSLFTDTSKGFMVASSEPSAAVDVVVRTASSTFNRYNFTPLGRQIIKVLYSLGYRFQWSTVASENKDFSALPLLALLRVYLDYFWPYQYRDLVEYKTLESFLRYDVEHDFSSTELHHLLQVIGYVSYSNDYFTAAFDEPTGPNNGDSSPIVVNDNASGIFNANQIGTTPYDSSSHTSPVISADLESEQAKTNAITQNSLNWLHAISNYLRRHQLAGSRTIDRFLARYGVKPSNASSDTCYRIGSASIPMTVLDQMSTAQTDEANLGDYSGKGYIMDIDQNLPHFSFDADADFGLFFVLASIVPSTGYVTGVDRHVFETSKLDLFNPEFDALGCQAIDTAELYMPFDGSSLDGERIFGNVFGFIPRDAHRKVKQDWLTGDYVLASHNKAGDVSSSWHLFRMISPSVFDAQTADEIHHKPNFVFGYDSSQFDRIFYNTDNSADHFYCDFFFKVYSRAPFKKLFDFVDFDNDEHNKEVTVDVGQTN